MTKPHSALSAPDPVLCPLCQGDYVDKKLETAENIKAPAGPLEISQGEQKVRKAGEREE